MFLPLNQVEALTAFDCCVLLSVARLSFTLQQKLYNAFGAKCMPGVRMCSAQQRASQRLYLMKQADYCWGRDETMFA